MERKTIRAATVSEALAKGLKLMTKSGCVTEESRNGGVTVWDGPVITHSLNPLRRVLFSPMRNANPWFNLFESLWMLAGRNDLALVAQYNRQMAVYSDDGGKTQPAAYGFRWRKFFGYDQIEMLVAELKRNPGTRRCVLAMWDGGHHTQAIVFPRNGDLQNAINGSADVPCNTECYFTARDGKLYMSVQCRSNDLLWGAHGANVVHFSILLEYVAALAGLEVGEMFQYSWNYHLYDGILKHPIKKVIDDLYATDRYTGRDAVQPTPIFSPSTMDEFAHDLPLFMDTLDPAKLSMPGFDREVTHEFLRGTAIPMFCAWQWWKNSDVASAVDACSAIEGTDWRIACGEWMLRKQKAL